MKQKNKAFDCIEMKRRIQEQIYEDTKGMNRAEVREYTRQRIANSQFAFFLDRPASGTPSAARHG
ncbi:MAG: hypothetical protein NTX50_03190 [Candidatus Sumerlaeota bacterium]|nr:hypothetical protein [Candidatus Sumerlaeota bacterium]